MRLGDSLKITRFITQIDPDKYDQAYWPLEQKTDTQQRPQEKLGLDVGSELNLIRMQFHLDVNDKQNANPRKSLFLLLILIVEMESSQSIMIADSNRLLAKVK